jgi:GNAT superfamily N-acetyltransferase
MSDPIRIESLNRKNKRFYGLFGPVFGSRAIAKQVGIPAYDDADKVWLAAFSGDVMVGWLSVRGRVVSDCYVTEEHRNLGVLSKLLATAIASFDSPLRATCTAASVGVFRKAGFKVVRRTKNFTVMELHNA